MLDETHWHRINAKVASHVFSLLASVEGTTVCLEIPLQSLPPPPPPGHRHLVTVSPPHPGDRRALPRDFARGGEGSTFFKAALTGLLIRPLLGTTQKTVVLAQPSLRLHTVLLDPRKPCSCCCIGLIVRSCWCACDRFGRQTDRRTDSAGQRTSSSVKMELRTSGHVGNMLHG